MKDNTAVKQAVYSEAGFVFDVSSVAQALANIQDRRAARGKRYSLLTILMLLLLGKLSGEDGPEGIADWAKARSEALSEMLGLTRRTMPHATTYMRVMQQGFDLAQAMNIFKGHFERSVRSGQQICVDGKQVCGTRDGDNGRNVYLLGAYHPATGAMLMQVEIAEGEGELTAAPKLLKALNLRDMVITGDAGFAQRNLSILVCQNGGHYLWKLKENQPGLLADVQQAFAPQSPALPGFSNPKDDFRIAESNTCGHGRVEHRKLTASSMLKGHRDWPGLEQVIKIECAVYEKKTGQQTHTVCYAITSLSAAQADAPKLLRLHRTHWGIEAKSHWRRDAILGEDGCDLRKGAAAVMAFINNLAIAMLRFCSTPSLTMNRRLFSASPDKALKLLICAP